MGVIVVLFIIYHNQALPWLAYQDNMLGKLECQQDAETYAVNGYTLSCVEISKGDI